MGKFKFTPNIHTSVESTSLGPTKTMSTASDALPPIAALFLVVFDKRVGYKIAWERSTEGLELAGVEYRSLASGLHNVESDLM